LAADVKQAAGTEGCMLYAYVAAVLMRAEA
jgi:hypothetical protein